MKKKYFERKTQVLIIAICVLFVAVSFSSVTAVDPMDDFPDFDWEIIDNDVITGHGGFFPKGSVGIGTTSPNSKLDVSGDIRITNPRDSTDYLHISSGDSSTSLTRISDGGAVGSVSINSAGGLSAESVWSWFGFTAETGDVIVKQGNVGIGITNPSEKLEVDGNVKATSFIGDGGSLTGVVTTESDYDTTNDSWTGTGDIYTTSGNVGIGITTPSVPLDVQGSIHTTGNIDVSGNQVQDYYGFPHPDYDSGWVNIPCYSNKEFTHNLSGSPENYYVDMWYKGSSWGINIDGQGDPYTAYWYDLTDSTISVHRGAAAWTNYIRIRIWVIQD